MDYTQELVIRHVDYHEADENQIMINCVFHSDNNPSMTVNTKTGQFHCFSCKESGGFVKLISQIDGISIGEARRQLEEGRPHDAVVEEIKEALEETVENKGTVGYYSVRSFHKMFEPVEGTPGMDYLIKRKLSRETAIKFDLRWSDSGVMINRVVFPIYTIAGKLLSYGGRAVHLESKPKTRKARSASDALYGLYELLVDQGSFNSLPYLMIVEGEFDVMYLQQLGYNAVSTMGTAELSEHQLSLIGLFSKSVIWSYDGDVAGRTAQEKALKKSSRFVPSVGVNLPEGKDPNDLSSLELKNIYRSVL